MTSATSSIYADVSYCPPDGIFEVTKRFKADTRPHAVNLGIGVYKGSDGETPAFDVVRTAEKALATLDIRPGYLPIAGDPKLKGIVPELVFGADSASLREERVLSIHTPGGTGALALGARFLHTVLGKENIYVSDPTWGNHINIFEKAGLSIHKYPYYNRESGELDFVKMTEVLSQVPEGAVVLLHACCHNPTGVDPSEKQWREIAQIFKENKLSPFFDFAYHGFGKGLLEDSRVIKVFFDEFGLEGQVAYSFSKSMSLYERRTGALMMVGASLQDLKNVQGHLEADVRGLYSNPPADGARIVGSILSDPEQKEKWIVELTGYRERIQKMRALLINGLGDRGHDLSAVKDQNGMFSYIGLKPEEVEMLAVDYAVYALPTGRLCVAALTENNMEHVVSSIADVLDKRAATTGL